jgi:phosphotriesterase-related protein
LPLSKVILRCTVTDLNERGQKLSKINSVKGPVDSSELGITLIHEHLRIRSEAVLVQYPHLYNEEAEYIVAIEQVKKVIDQGVKTICDPTVLGLGRDIRFMERVAIDTGIQVIAATGVYTFHDLPDHFKFRKTDYMADLFIRDIEVGIQNTNIKAAFLKCATDSEGMSRGVEKVLRAVARAHLATGVPIMTHSHPRSKTGLLQIDIFKEEGVDPKHILIGHCGDTDDLDYLQNLLSHGVYIGLDRYGYEIPNFSQSQRNWTVLQLLNLGYVDQLFLSQDYCCSTDAASKQEMKRLFPKWSMDFLMREIIPQLEMAGVTNELIHTMMIDNVRKWLVGASKG